MSEQPSVSPDGATPHEPWWAGTTAAPRRSTASGWTWWEQGWRESPVWPIVVLLGASGLLLTGLLLLNLSTSDVEAGLGEIELAGPSQVSARRPVEVIDSRLRLAGLKKPDEYPAEFMFGGQTTVSVARVTRRPTGERAPIPVVPPGTPGQPNLQFDGAYLRQRANLAEVAAVTLNGLSVWKSGALDTLQALTALRVLEWQAARAVATPPAKIAVAPYQALDLGGQGWSSRTAPADTPQGLESRREVDASIDVYGPRQVAVGGKASSSVVIRSHGDGAARAIVREDRQQLPTVVDANPRAVQHGTYLERVLGAELLAAVTPLELTWLAEQAGPARHLAQVEFQAEVDAETLIEQKLARREPTPVSPDDEPVLRPIPERPDRAVRPVNTEPVETPRVVPPAAPEEPASIPEPEPAPAEQVPAERAPAEPVEPEEPSYRVECRVSGTSAIAVGETAHLEVEVENKSPLAVHGVVVLAEVPEGLTHDDGALVEHVVGTLKPGERHRTRLLLQGSRAGEAVPRLLAISEEAAQSLTSARLSVHEAAAKAVAPPTRCGCWLGQPTIIWFE